MTNANLYLVAPVRDVTLYSCEEWIDLSSLLALLPSEIRCNLGPRCLPLWLHIMQHAWRSEDAVTAAGELAVTTLLRMRGTWAWSFPAGFPTMPLTLCEAVAAPKGESPSLEGWNGHAFQAFRTRILKSRRRRDVFPRSSKRHQSEAAVRPVKATGDVRS